MAKAKEVEQRERAETEPASPRVFKVRMEGAIASGVIDVKATSPDEAKEILVGWFSRGLTVIGG